MEGRLYGLDALRGVAALSVLAYHIALLQFGYRSDGFLAVDFFFMLSGYVMARLLEARPTSSLAFLRARYRRFWPTMAVGSLLGILLILASGKALSAYIVISGVLLIPSFAGGLLFPLNAPAWSIFFELTVNTLHPILTRPVMIACFFASLFMVAVIIYLSGGYSVGTTDLLSGFARTLMAYSLGALLYMFWRDKPPFKIPLVVGAALLCAPMFINISAFFNLAIVLFAWPIVLASGLTAQPSYGRALGSISFPLYAVHGPIVEAAVFYDLNPVLPIAASISLAAMLAFCPLPRRLSPSKIATAP